MKWTSINSYAGYLAGALVIAASGLSALADPIDDLPPARRDARREPPPPPSRGEARTYDRDSDRPAAGAESSRNRGPLGLFLRDDGEYGVLVTEVRADSPAARAGLRRGDYLIKINGQDASSLSEALGALAELRRGNPVDITVDRNGRDREFHVTLEPRRDERTDERFARGESTDAERRISDRAERFGERVGRIIERVREATEQLDESQPAPSIRDRYDRYSQDPQGIEERPRYGRDDERIDNRSDDTFAERRDRRDTSRNQRANWQDERTATRRPAQRVRPSLGVTLNERENGRLFISRVQPNSAAERAGLEEGDELLRVDDQRVYSHADVMRTLGEHQPGDHAELKIRRSGQNEFVDVRLGEDRVGADVPERRTSADRQLLRDQRRESRRATVGEAVRGVLSQARELLEETDLGSDQEQLHEQARRDSEIRDEQHSVTEDGGANDEVIEEERE